jgi:hypothetical protein
MRLAPFFLDCWLYQKNKFKKRIGVKAHPQK